MAELYTMTKPGEKDRRVLAGARVEQAEANGWTIKGKKRIDTEVGERTVPAAEARERIAKGKASPVSSETIRKRRGAEFVKERYGDEKWQTFGEAGLASLSMGLIDPGDISEWSEGDAGATALRAEANPRTSTLGSVTGSIVGALAPGGLGKILPTGIAARGASAGGRAVAARTGSKAAGIITEGALDGAFFGAGQAYANAVLNDQPITAEQIVSNMTSEALFGGVAGGVLGAGLAGLGKLASKKAAAKKIASQVSDSVDSISDRVRTDIGLNLANKSDSTAVQNTLDAFDSKAFLDFKPKKFNKFLAQVDSPAAKQTIAEPFVAPAGLEPPLSSPGMTPAPRRPVVGEFAGLEGTPIQQLPTSPGMQQAPQALNLPKDETLGVLNQPLRDADGRLTEAGELLQHSGVDIQAATSGPNAEHLAKLYAATKYAKQIEATATTPGIIGKLGSRLNPLGGRAGAVVGGMFGAIGKVEQGIGKSIKGFIMAGGKPRRGTIPAASTILGKVRFDEDAGERPSKGSQKLGKRASDFKKRAAELDRIASDPEKAKRRVHESLKEVRALKPILADMMAKKALDRMLFLHSVMPRSQSPGSPFSHDRWTASQTEIDKFSRIVAAAEHPLSILDDLTAGKLTQESVDAVKQLYPEIYNDILMVIVDNIDEIKSSVNYAGRIQLGILFQVPTDEVLRPDFILRMQSNLNQREQEQEQQGGGQFSTPGSLQNSLTNQQTASQRVEGK